MGIRCLSLSLVAFMLTIAGLAGACHAQGGGAVDQPPPTEQAQPQEQRRAPQEDEREFSFYERVELIDESFAYDEDHPAVGHWHGNVKTSFGWPAASVVIERNEQGVYTVETSVTPGAMPHREGEVVNIEGSDIEFRAPLEPVDKVGSLTFDGRISEDGQRMTGMVILPDEMLRNNLAIMRRQRAERGMPGIDDEEAERLLEEWREGEFELARTPLAVNLDTKVAYGGELTVGDGLGFEIVLVFAETPGGNWVGHIDIPGQFVGGWVLDHVVREGDTIQAHMGGSSPAIITGTVSDDGETFAGTWRYRNLDQQLEFEFKRRREYDKPNVPQPPQRPRPGADANPESRPQYPEAPMPYETQDVQIEHPENHVLAGTLTIPHGEGPFPGVVLLGTSDARDRDANMFGHKWFLVLADRLTRNGIAVLRYDKRGVGKSTGRFQDTGLEEWASDAAASYNFLRAIDRVDPKRIGFIGHGEGALVGARAAHDVDDPAFLALLAPPGVPGWEYKLDTTAQNLQQLEQAEEAPVQAMLDAQEALFRALVEGKDDETLNGLALALAETQSALAESIGAGSSLPPEHRARMILASLKQPATGSLLKARPAEVLAGIDSPVFAAFGTLDRVTRTELNRPAIEEAFADAPGQLTVKTYEELNHLFQPAETGFPVEYGRSRITISEQVMEDLAGWIHDVAGPADSLP